MASLAPTAVVFVLAVRMSPGLPLWDGRYEPRIYLFKPVEARTSGFPT